MNSTLIFPTQGIGYTTSRVKEFLRYLWERLFRDRKKRAFCAVFDADLSGFFQFCSYKYGVVQQYYRNALLNVPSLQYIGMSLHDTGVGGFADLSTREREGTQENLESLYSVIGCLHLGRFQDGIYMPHANGFPRRRQFA